MNFGPLWLHRKAFEEAMASGAFLESESCMTPSTRTWC